MALLNVFATVAAVNAIVDVGASEAAGMVVLQPALGLSTAYRVGEDVWGSHTVTRAVLVFVTGSTEQLNCFGPDASGKLVNIGLLDAGWQLLQGDIGSEDGHARRLPR